VRCLAVSELLPAVNPGNFPVLIAEEIQAAQIEVHGGGTVPRNRHYEKALLLTAMLALTACQSASKTDSSHAVSHDPEKEIQAAQIEVHGGGTVPRNRAHRYGKALGIKRAQLSRRRKL
jgi:hypothetical protein